MLIRIGTRGSKLAQWQAQWVRGRIEEMFPSIEVELVKIKTKGDKILDSPLAKVGGKGLFVKEIEEALLEDRVDIAVHSMKDVPTRLPEDLEIGAIPERDEPWDLLIMRERYMLQNLPLGAKVGTSSLRRQAQLLALRPDLNIVPLRGNLDTRFQKLFQDELDAIVVAKAGVKRLAITGAHMEDLPPEVCLPAIGQGALALEIRRGELTEIVRAIHHEESALAVKAERAFLREIGGSCQVPVAALGQVKEERLVLRGLIASPDGRSIYRDEVEGKAERFENLGRALAKLLLDRGGRRIMEQILGWELSP